MWGPYPGRVRPGKDPGPEFSDGRRLTLLCTIPRSSPAPYPPRIWLYGGWETPVGGWKPQSPPPRSRGLPLPPRPPCPARVPPSRPPPAEQRVSARRPEGRAAAGAHGRGLCAGNRAATGAAREAA